MVKKSGIYKLSWPNGYFYIGQSINMYKRWTQHKSGFTNGRTIKHHPKLYSVWEKYGEPTFNILEKCPVDLLNLTEQKYITENWSNSLFCNTSPSSKNSRGIKRSKPAWQKGKKFTKEHRKNLSLSHKNMIGIKNNNHKLTEDQVKEIRTKYVKHKNGSIRLGREYDVSNRTILYIINNKRYANVVS